MSAECTAAGLFPPSEDEIWNNDLRWQPIPIHTKPLNEDYLLNSFVHCSRFNYLFKQRLESEEVKAIMAEHDSLIRFMERNSGSKLNRADDVWALYSGLLIEYRRGLMWVHWIFSNCIIKWIDLKKQPLVLILTACSNQCEVNTNLCRGDTVAFVLDIQFFSTVWDLDLIHKYIFQLAHFKAEPIGLKKL